MSGPDDRDLPPHARDTLPEVDAGCVDPEFVELAAADLDQVITVLEGSVRDLVTIVAGLRRQAAAARREGLREVH
jgi:hypothetical protein